MADRDTDKPENKGLRGFFNKRRKMDGAGHVFGQEFKSILMSDRLDSAAFGVPILFGVIFAGPVLLMHDTTVMRDYTPDLSLSHGIAAEPSTEAGASSYTAITADDGKTGYMLVSDQGRYRLYSFDISQNQANERVMTYVADQDDAWHIIRNTADQMVQGLRAASDPQASPPSQNIETVRFSEISGVLSEGDHIRRYGEGIADADADYSSMRERFEAQSTLWLNASQAVFNGQYGFAAGEQEEKAGEYTETVERDFGLAKAVLGLMGSISGFGLTLMTVNAANRTRRRLKNSR